MRVKRLIEAVLFVSGKPVGVKELANSLGLTYKRCKDLILELKREYERMNSSVEIKETVGRKFVMQLKPEFNEKALEYQPSSGKKKALLKTLSFVAYKQPILQSNVVRVRGTSCYKHLKKLEEDGLIERRPKERTYILTTTKKFAEFYGLESASLEEVKRFIQERMRGD
ncbi:MAG: SMC-Scp complex subunit ScpB [Candidatus Methanofastidiosia archaeon]